MAPNAARNVTAIPTSPRMLALRVMKDGNSATPRMPHAASGRPAHALARAGRPLAAWGILGVALFPSFMTLNASILGDVGMAVTFLAAFGAIFWHRAQDRDVPPAIAGLSFVLLLYGALVRSNAIFAVVPLVCYLVRPQWLRRPWRVLLLSLPVAL